MPTFVIVPLLLVILIVHIIFNISCLRYADSQGPGVLHLREGVLSKITFYAMQKHQGYDILPHYSSINYEETVINVIHNEQRIDVRKQNRKYPRREKGHDVEAWRNDISNDKWFQFFTPNGNKSNPHDYKFILNNVHICRGDVKLVIVVHSHASRIKQREAIRATWAKAACSKKWLGRSLSAEVRVVFLLGVSKRKAHSRLLRKESELHGDIVQEDFNDSYTNLTLKTIMGLRWASEFCSSARFLLKTDDDVFVHIPRLLLFIKGIDRRDTYGNVMYGRINYPIHARRSGKWAVSEHHYPFKIFPKYASGGGYLLPVSMSRTLFSMSKYFPQFPLEDVGVTGILRKALGYQLHTFPALIESRWRKHSAVCDLARITHCVLVHGVKPAQMFTLQRVLARNGAGCPSSVNGFKKKRKAFGKDLPLTRENESSK